MNFLTHCRRGLGTKAVQEALLTCIAGTVDVPEPSHVFWCVLNIFFLAPSSHPLRALCVTHTVSVDN